MLEREMEVSVPLPGILAVDAQEVTPAFHRDDRYGSVVAEFATLSLYPPKQDPYMSACYQAAFQLSQQDGAFGRLISQVLQERDITPKHFSNLFYRGVQLVELFYRQNGGYPHAFITPEQWGDELKDILRSEDAAVLQDVLLHKDTTTTIYQRYAGARSIMRAMFPQRSFAVADFGCGGNYGLRGMALPKPEPFKPFIDHTPGQVVQQLARKPLRISEGLAIDREDPQDVDVTMWRLACSFYPQELSQLPDVIALEERLTQAERIRFYKGDLLALPVGSKEIPAQRFDAVIMSTFCYQLDIPAQEQVLRAAAQMLKPDGLVIVQDFAEKDRNNPHWLNFNVSWFNHAYSYRNFVTGTRTGWEMKEVLRWNNGRCEEVEPGEDFTLIGSSLFQPAA